MIELGSDIHDIILMLFTKVVMKVFGSFGEINLQM